MKRSYFTMRLFITGMFIVFTLLSPKDILGQNDFQIGDWRSHFPYTTLNSVTTDNNGTIYASSEFSMFSYNIETGLIDIKSKIAGLSDIGIRCIKYNTKYNLLFIAYDNSNIDIIKDGNTINMSDIYRSNIMGNKTINNIYFLDKYAYLSCGFGIVVIDLENIVVADTYFIGDNGQYVNVTDLTYWEDKDMIFAATDNGIFYAADASTANLLYFGNWTQLTDLPTTSANCNFIELFNNRLIVNITTEDSDSDTLLVYSSDFQWSYFSEEQSVKKVNSIEAYSDALVIAFTVTSNVYDKDLNLTLQSWQYINGDYPMPAQTIRDNNGLFWSADKRKGLVSFTNGWTGTYHTPTGPQVAKAFKIAAYNKSVYLLAGGFNASWSPLYTAARYSVFTNDEWSTVSGNTLSGLSSYWDIVDIAFDPRNANHYFIATYGSGLIEVLNNNIVNIYNGTNSPLLPPSSLSENNVRVGGLAYDDNNNLWITTSLNSQCLCVLLADGTWGDVSLPSSFSGIEVSDITIDSYGQKWLRSRNAASIYVVNDNETPGYGGDDMAKVLTYATGNGAIPGQTVYDIAADRDGEVWIGTDQGIAVFYYPNRIFTGEDFDASRILVQSEDGDVRPLLESESVTDICVDYGNKKWIGTSTSGIYYVSEDGTEEIAHYTEDNSPLFSNEISEICINYIGEVFMGTANGVCSYRSSSSEPQDTNDSIYAYPNPVRPDYTGLIAINGLTENSYVKITDMSGKIVFAARSEGGQITWNGTTPKGGRAASGVYIVFVVDSNGKQRAATKILFIR